MKLLPGYIVQQESLSKDTMCFLHFYSVIRQAGLYSPFKILHA